MENQLSVLLIGLGGIACKYDFPLPFIKGELSIGIPRSHLGAAMLSGYRVIGGVDKNFKARKEFEINTSLSTWGSLESFPNSISVDIVVVSTPASTHKDVILEVCQYLKPKGIICEKPFGASSADSKYIIDLTRSNQIPIRVNYSRNFSPGFSSLRSFVDIDKFVSGNITYSLGLRENGSHFLRFALELLGPPNSYHIDTKRSLDKNPSFSLLYPGNREMNFLGHSSRNIRTGEMIFETKDYLVLIREGSEFEIRELKKQVTTVLSISDLQIKLLGNLKGGLEEIYLDQNWIHQRFSADDVGVNRLDHLCNKIMDQMLNA